MIGALIGAGASLLGGLFGRSSEKKQAQTNRAWELEDRELNIQDQLAYGERVRESAERGGFNPLTMLGAGLGGSTQGGIRGSSPLASTALISGALSQAGTAIGQKLSGELDRQRQRDQLDLDLAKIKLEQARASAAVGNRAASIGARPARGGNMSVSGGKMVNGKFVQDPSKIVGNPDRSSIQIFGYDVQPHPGFSNAQAQEDRYGDLVSWAGGLSTLVADGVHTLQVNGVLAGGPAGNRSRHTMRNMKAGHEARHQRTYQMMGNQAPLSNTPVPPAGRLRLGFRNERG